MAQAPMDRELQKSMALAFAPVHKRALGGNVDFKSLAAKVMGGKPKAYDA